MVEQDRTNYRGHDAIDFRQADLGAGFALVDEPPFDLYFSSYSSLSHIAHDRLRYLTEDIFRHAGDTAYLVFDLFGRLSLEWPGYWGAAASVAPAGLARLERYRDEWNAVVALASAGRRVRSESSKKVT